MIDWSLIVASLHNTHLDGFNWLTEKSLTFFQLLFGLFSAEFRHSQPTALYTSNVKRIHSDKTPPHSPELERHQLKIQNQRIRNDLETKKKSYGASRQPQDDSLEDVRSIFDENNFKMLNRHQRVHPSQLLFQQSTSQ